MFIDRNYVEMESVDDFKQHFSILIHNDGVAFAGKNKYKNEIQFRNGIFNPQFELDGLIADRSVALDMNRCVIPNLIPKI